MIYKVLVAVEAPSAASAARVVQHRMDGRRRTFTSAVIRVEDVDGVVRWRAPKPPRKVR